MRSTGPVGPLVSARDPRRLCVLLVTADSGSERTGRHRYTEQLHEQLTTRASVVRHALESSGVPRRGPRGRTRRGWEHARKRGGQFLALVGGGDLHAVGEDRQAAVHDVESTIRAVRPDVVVLDHLRVAWMAPLLRAPGARVVYVAHNAESATAASIASLTWNPALRAALTVAADRVRRLERTVVRHCDAVVVLSSADRRRLLAWEEPALGVHVVPPMPPRGLHRALADVPPHPAVARRDVLLLGSFRWWPKRRNAHWLVRRCMPTVHARIAGLRLHVVGTEADRLGLTPARAPRVHVHSDVDSVLPYLAARPVAAIPERQQGGVKLKTIEAASAALPIVSTPEGIEGTGLRPGVSCLIGASAKKFADALVTLSRDRGVAERLGRQAREDVDATCGPVAADAACEALIDVLARSVDREITDGNRSRVRCAPSRHP